MKTKLLAGAVTLAVLVPVAGAGAQSSYYYNPKVKPGLTLKVKPKRDRKRPFRFKASGKVLRKGAPRSACRGKVKIRFKKGKKTLASGKARVKRNCTYAKKFKVRKKGKRIKVTARFGGNSVLRAKSAKPKFVRAG